MKQMNEKALTRKKISVKNVKLSDQPKGFSFQGIYRGQVLGAPFQKATDQGEIVTKQLTSVIFENAGERTAYVSDKGLLQALNESQVKEGDLVEIVKLGKELIKGGSRSMNTYDIFALEG